MDQYKTLWGEVVSLRLYNTNRISSIIGIIFFLNKEHV